MVAENRRFSGGQTRFEHDGGALILLVRGGEQGGVRQGKQGMMRGRRGGWRRQPGTLTGTGHHRHLPYLPGGTR
jgi:hypothetical protein